MRRKNYGLYFAALAASTLLGAWLIGLLGFLGVGDPLDNNSGLGSLLGLLGFLLFLGSLCGLVFLISRLQPPISREEAAAWDEIRKRGRGSFLTRATLRGVVIGFISSSLILVKDLVLGKPLDGDVWAYALLVPIFVFGSLYAAHRVWNNHEWAHEKLSRDDSPGEASTSWKQT
jgi:hypothetical protein